MLKFRHGSRRLVLVYSLLLSAQQRRHPNRSWQTQHSRSACAPPHCADEAYTYTRFAFTAAPRVSARTRECLSAC